MKAKTPAGAKDKHAKQDTDKLYYGDNLEVMRSHVPDESVDMIYLDPPFNSKTDYNLLFKDGNDMAQVKAFEDKWTFNGTAYSAYHDLMKTPVSDVMQGLKKILDDGSTMAYLCIMTERLLEMHRVLKPTGSIFLHCDPTASHYLKVVMDAIFGQGNFRNEIVWRRSRNKGTTRKLAAVHDSILFYVKGEPATFNRIVAEHDSGYVEKHYKKKDAGGNYQAVALTGPGKTGGESGMPWRGVDPSKSGRHWAAPREFPPHMEKPGEYDGLSVHKKLDMLDKHGLILWPEKENGMPRFKRYLYGGTAITDVIVDVNPLSPKSPEYLRFQTQKPRALISRFIEMSTNKGEVVMDPFCGCGTTVVAAAALSRQFIGIDASVEATGLVQRRIKEAHNLDVEIEGLPYTIQQAEELGATDGQEFQRWIISKMPGFHPNPKQSGDGGIDGSAKVFFRDDYRTVICSVKGGRNLNPAMLRELVGTVKKEDAEFGVLVTVHPPPKRWYAGARTEGVVSDGMVEYPRIQIYTVRDMFDGRMPNLPALQHQIPSGPRAKPKRGRQKRL